jgi:hypothetical protein
VTSGALNAGVPTYGSDSFFVTKLSQAGRLLYGAILGQVDSASECCSLARIMVNAQGEVLIAGSIGSDSTTGAVHWPTTPGAYQKTSLQPGGVSPVVAKLAADGSHLVFSTLAGAGIVQDAAVDATGDTILLGNTYGSVPVTTDAYFPQSAGASLRRSAQTARNFCMRRILANPRRRASST